MSAQADQVARANFVGGPDAIKGYGSTTTINPDGSAVVTFALLAAPVDQKPPVDPT